MIPAAPRATAALASACSRPPARPRRGLVPRTPARRFRASSPRTPADQPTALALNLPATRSSGQTPPTSLAGGLSGGTAEANEAPEAALARELREEPGPNAALRGLLVVDWVPPHRPLRRPDRLHLGAGPLDETRATQPHLHDDELAEAASASIDNPRAPPRPDAQPPYADDYDYDPGGGRGGAACRSQKRRDQAVSCGSSR
ncbi:NUDIX domain-containing protein [Streptomyces sp. NPDC060020]|uniref:NUDIX domain-containing protein n=1 Tax=Streptomyces sp. NPDC060020 TaxID=3347038 RepID=UPI0036ADFDF5